MKHLIEALAHDPEGEDPKPEHPSLCGGNFCCQYGEPRMESSTHQVICRDLTTTTATPFPHDFCTKVQQCVDADCAYRRKEVLG